MKIHKIGMKKSKAQSLIIQFMLFFMIGFALFVTIGNLFKNQSDALREEIINKSLKMTANFISSNAINIIDSCKQCDYAVVMMQLQNETASYILDLRLNNDGLNVSIPFWRGKYYTTNLHNLNYPQTEWSGHTASSQPLTLTYNRTKNELRIG
jgi:hypothetical protein